MVFCHQNYQKFCVKNCSSEREKLLKFETEDQEFENVLRSLEQFIQTWKVRTISGNIMLSELVPWGFFYLFRSEKPPGTS